MLISRKERIEMLRRLAMPLVMAIAANNPCMIDVRTIYGAIVVAPRVGQKHGVIRNNARFVASRT